MADLPIPPPSPPAWTRLAAEAARPAATRGRTKSPPPIYIEDRRAVATPRSNYTNRYPWGHLLAIAGAGIEHGIDPATSLSMAIAEGMGSPAFYENPRRALNNRNVTTDEWIVLQDLLKTYTTLKQRGQETDQALEDLLMAEARPAMRYAANQRDYWQGKGHGPLRQLQAYNGLGILPGEYNYPLPTPGRPVNTKQNPVYAKKVMDLRANMLMRSPAIQQLVKALGGRSRLDTQPQRTSSSRKR